MKWLSQCRLFPARYFIEMPKNEEELKVVAASRKRKYDRETAKMRKFLEDAGVEIA